MTKLLLKLFIKDYEQTDKPEIRSKYGWLAGMVGIIFNVILFLTKLVIGAISNSIAITADALNNLTDASSSVITLIGFKLSEKPADKDHPYGHARYEYIAGFVVAVLVLVIGVELFLSSGEKIFKPSLVKISTPVVVILSLSIIIKAWLMLFNKSLGKKINSSVLIATSMDCRNDIISTAVVFIGVFLGAYFKFPIDGYLGILVSTFILFSGFGIVRDTLSLLLGKSPDSEQVKEISDKIMSYDGILGMHDLMVHDYGPGHRFASVHVEMDAELPPLECHEIIDDIERDFKEEEKLDLVIHYDPILTGENALNGLRHKLSLIIESISSELSFHDFRVVAGNGHTNLIFDIVIPDNFDKTEQEIKSYIDGALSQEEMKYYTVITFDSSYVPMS